MVFFFLFNPDCMVGLTKTEDMQNCWGKQMSYYTVLVITMDHAAFRSDIGCCLAILSNICYVF